MDQPRLFAVVSWGAAATHWLTRVLNAHPQVLCFHHLMTSLNNVKPLQMNPMEYMEFLAHAGAGYQLAGDVHGIPLDSLEDLKKQWGRQFRFAIITRHPVSRVRSAYNLWNNYLLEKPSASLTELTGEGGSPESTQSSSKENIFKHFATMVNQVVDEIVIMEPFQMERLTTDFGEINRLLDHLSNGELQFDRSDGLMDKGPGHRKKNDTPRESFDDMPKWQRDMFIEKLSPEARKVYENLGYDLGFVKK